ncbi:tRNA (adenosine(37)-N6)-threonylcarbamoyltransferase complex dimerization subunit type 1 TsaB [Phenylobacterium soli]|uniref:N(6)-L-threonylcarbamoyladenine synthase n=1 Tax=Phenylobacterium soli TaxID=2170551 RepID=A0A328ATC4_9CAUL|nr:tRNA (adenosine(37)-N6)-threonylcarbamoyltransferase complex dimerization subunit type 1 TsaB [Phenylobacterium soli]RAK56188.1 tRNA (adenosine(37)-N6)-threonylcarbamoyltransferase complex dimerization subunit type 1 TsaB [Phenylobacterium soli]
MVLGLDTCLSSCSVAVLDTEAGGGGRVLAYGAEVMARGHQERLAPMAQAVMADAGLAFGALERIAVTVGPGSFTGLRVGVAFAKGLAASLSIGAAGVGTLEALAAEAPGLVFAAIDARRDQIYLQAFEDGHALMAPDALHIDTAAARLAEIAGGRTPTLVGSGAALLAPMITGAPVIAAEGCDARKVARLGAARAPSPLRPLYLRAPDAKLPASARDNPAA